MLLTATLLGLIAALGILDGRLLGVSMIDRPLVMCALTGLVCGNLHEGILIGATLEWCAWLTPALATWPIVMRRRVIPGWLPLCTWEAQRCSIF